MKRVRVKQGKPQSVMGFVVGLIFCGIGLFAVVPAFGLFGIFWTAIAVAITIVNAINAFGKKGVVSHEIIIEDDDDNMLDPLGMNKYEVSVDSDEENVSDTKKRLDSLKELLDAGIISKSEYDERRNKIIDEATK